MSAASENVHPLIEQISSTAPMSASLSPTAKTLIATTNYFPLSNAYLPLISLLLIVPLPHRLLGTHFMSIIHLRPRLHQLWVIPVLFKHDLGLGSSNLIPSSSCTTQFVTPFQKLYGHCWIRNPTHVLYPGLKISLLTPSNDWWV